MRASPSPMRSCAPIVRPTPSRTSSALLNGLGVAFIASGRVDDAIGAFERAVTVDPEHIGAHENLARARAMKASPKR